MFTKNAESNESTESKNFAQANNSSASAEKLHADAYNSPGHGNPFKLAKEFKDMDTNRDRLLTVDELIAAKKAEGRREFNHVVDSSARMEMTGMDHDRNGSVSKKEFHDAKAKSGASDAEIDAQFKKLDKDGNGSISLDEIKKGEENRLADSFKAMQKADEETARKQFKMLDKNHDGKVTPREYIDFGTGKPDAGVLPGLILHEAKKIGHHLPHIKISF